MRDFPFFWVKREWLWYQVHWRDDRRDLAQEDYGPEWHMVVELEQGKFEPESRDGLVLDARRIEGPPRDRMWAQLGPPA